MSYTLSSNVGRKVLRISNVGICICMSMSEKLNLAKNQFSGIASTILSIVLTHAMRILRVFHGIRYILRSPNDTVPSFFNNEMHRRFANCSEWRKLTLMSAANIKAN